MSQSTLWTSILILGTAQVLLSGCASFSGGTLPPSPPYAAIEVVRKPSAAVKLEFRQFLNGAPITLLRGTAESAHSARLVEELESSGYFSAVSAGEGPADLLIDVKFRDEGSASMGMAFLTGLTLYLVPSWATDNWVVDAVVTVPASGRSEEFHVEEFVTQYQQIFLLPVMPFKTTPMVTSKVQGNIWRTLVAKLGTSGLIEDAAGELSAPSTLQFDL